MSVDLIDFMKKQDLDYKDRKTDSKKYYLIFHFKIQLQQIMIISQNNIKTDKRTNAHSNQW